MKQQENEKRDTYHTKNTMTVVHLQK